MILSNKNIDWLQAQAETIPNSCAIQLHNREITYDTLNKLVNAAAANLSNLKIVRGDLVPFISTNDWREVVLILALWRLGAVPAPMHSKLSRDELSKQIKFLESKIFIKHNDGIALEQVQCHQVEIDKIVNETGSELRFATNFNISNTAVVLFTSGSAGKPKAVELTFNSLYESTEGTDSVAHFTHADKFLTSLPFYHVGGFMIFIRSLLSGATLQFPAKAELIESLEKFEPTILSLVPTQLLQLIEADFTPHNALKTIFIGGGRADSNLLITATNKNYPVNVVYGSSETCSMITLNPTSMIKDKPASSGKTIGSNEILILKPGNKILEANQEGEIAVKAKSLFKTYLKNDSLKEEKMFGDYFKTGDYGYLDDEGYLFVLSRREDIVVSGGENINKNEVESVIRKLDVVNDVYIFGVDDVKWGQKLCAAIRLKDGANITTEQIQTQLKDKLPSFKIPKKIFFVESLPKTGIGKVDKMELLRVLKLNED